MKGKTRNILIRILCAVIAMGICLGAWAIGVATRSQNAAYRWLLGGSAAALVVMAIINGACRRKSNAAMYAKTAQQLHDEELQYKAETDASPADREKSIGKHIAAAAAWEAAVIVLLLLCCFSAGKILSPDGGGAVLSTVLIIAAFFLLTGYVLAPFGLSADDDGEDMPALTEGEYPHIFALIERAAKRAGIKSGVRAFFSDSGFFVFERRGKVNVCLDVVELSLLTDEETCAVLLHEFAHVRNADTAKRAKYVRLCQCLRVPATTEANVFGLSGILFGWFAERAAFESEHADYIDSRRREILADEFVKESGLSQAYVNATAKTAMYALFLEESTPDLSEAFFAGEECPDDACGLRLASFARHLGARKEYWDVVLRRELPARVDSHPTFRMRMELMGETDYDISAREADPEGLAEREKMRRAMGARIKKRTEGFFGQARLDWQERKKKRDAFLEREKTGEDIPVEELLDYAEKLYGLDNDCLLRVAERLERKDADSASAAYYRGIVLAERGDEACLPLLYRAAGEADFADDAMNRAGIFALRTGNQAVLDDYRSRVVPMAQSLMDEAALGRFSSKDELFPCDIPAPLLRPLIGRLVRAGGGNILDIRIAVKRAEGKAMYYYLISMRSLPRGAKGEAEREKETDAWEEVYHCLLENGLPEPYRAFIICTGGNGTLAKRIRKDGSHVYDSSVGILLPEEGESA